MEDRTTYLEWWRPLPRWLKAITLCVAYPVAFLMIYCILTGEANSLAALLAFLVFATCALLHIIFDARNHQNDHKLDAGLDLTIGGSD